MISGINTVKRFEGILKSNATPISFNLTKSKEGILNGIKVQTGKADCEKPVYNYFCKEGLDLEYFKEKMTDICEKVKDGNNLLKEIFEYGLNIKK